MPLIDIEAAHDERVVGYLDLKDAHLSQRQGLFVVEGRHTLLRLFETSRFQPESILLNEASWRALSQEIEQRAPGVPVYRASASVLEAISGFPIHRGCLALVRRPKPRDMVDFVEGLPVGERSLVLALEGLTNHDNVGGAFRNAMAFGVDGVLLCPRCCDPFYRKAIRTSLGGSLCVPFAQSKAWPNDLERLRMGGYQIVALDPEGRTGLHEYRPPADARVALVLGTEGEGLSRSVRDCVDATLRIEMASGIDSINVATAAGIALHHLMAQMVGRV